MNRLDPDQVHRNVRHNLDQICLIDTQMVFLKEFFEKVDFEKISRRQKSMKNFPGGEGGGGGKEYY